MERSVTGGRTALGSVDSELTSMRDLAQDNRPVGLRSLNRWSELLDVIPRGGLVENGIAGRFWKPAIARKVAEDEHT